MLSYNSKVTTHALGVLSSYAFETNYLLVLEHTRLLFHIKHGHKQTRNTRQFFSIMSLKYTIHFATPNDRK